MPRRISPRLAVAPIVCLVDVLVASLVAFTLGGVVNPAMPVVDVEHLHGVGRARITCGAENLPGGKLPADGAATRRAGSGEGIDRLGVPDDRLVFDPCRRPH
jgi:hypothetical protein